MTTKVTFEETLGEGLMLKQLQHSSFSVQVLHLEIWSEGIAHHNHVLLYPGLTAHKSFLT